MLFPALSLLLLTCSVLGESTAPAEGSGDNDIDYKEEGESEAGYIFGKPKNGKLVHDMRVFGNITIDWSPSRYPDLVKKGISIPLCHEWRMRRSFYEYQLPDLTRHHVSMEQDMVPGTLVYPLIMTGNRHPSTPEDDAAIRRRLPTYDSTMDIYVAAVHKVGRQENAGSLLDIVHISKTTWTLIWDRWATAPKKNPFSKNDAKYPRAAQTGRYSVNGSGFCDGGKHFEDILPKINQDAASMWPFVSIVGFYPVDLTSDVCNSTYCGCPKGPKEVITSTSGTYPEGRMELKKSPYFKDLEGYNRNYNNTEIKKFDLAYMRSVQDKIRTETFMQMSRFIRACYDREILARMGKEYKGDSLTDAQIKTNQKIFYPPYI